MPARSDQQSNLLLLARDRTARQYLRRVLEQGGYAVLPAGDCREAVALFLAHPIDLVVLDLRAPDLHGLVTYKLLTACQPHARFVITVTPPLDLTALSPNSSHAILRRPFDAATLLETVRQASSGCAPARGIGETDPAPSHSKTHQLREP